MQRVKEAKIKALKEKVRSIDIKIDKLLDEEVKLDNERERIEEEIERLEKPEEDDIGAIWKFSEEEVRRGWGLSD